MVSRREGMGWISTGFFGGEGKLSTASGNARSSLTGGAAAAELGSTSAWSSKASSGTGGGTVEGEGMAMASTSAIDRSVGDATGLGVHTASAGGCVAAVGTCSGEMLGTSLVSQGGAGTEL